MEFPDFCSYAYITCKIGKEALEIFTGPTTVFLDVRPCPRTVEDWTKSMVNGSFCLKKTPPSGRPSESGTRENIDNVRLMVEENPHLST